MSKCLMKAPFFGYWLTVDELHGYGTERATLSLRESNRHGQPGRRVGVRYAMKRSEVISFAFDLLDIAGKMLPSTTFTTSEAVFCSSAEPEPRNETFMSMERVEQENRQVAARRQRSVNAFSNLRRRLPTLQRLQRLLEQCNDDIAATLDVTLLMLEHTGDLPFRAEAMVETRTISPEGAVRH